MKLLTTLRISVLFVGFGAILWFAPPCRAQQETDPQSFDSIPASEAPAKPKSQPVAKKATSGQRTKNAATATVQPALARQAQDSQPSEAVAIPAKRTSKKREQDNR